MRAWREVGVSEERRVGWDGSRHSWGFGVGWFWGVRLGDEKACQNNAQRRRHFTCTQYFQTGPLLIYNKVVVVVMVVKLRILFPILFLDVWRATNRIFIISQKLFLIICLFLYTYLLTWTSGGERRSHERLCRKQLGKGLRRELLTPNSEAPSY